MPIGVFARRSGLTSSALRFYADSGLLPPAEVDGVSGCRYYLTEARRHVSALPGDAYGALVRTVIDEVAGAIARRDTARRACAPGAGV